MICLKKKKWGLKPRLRAEFKSDTEDFSEQADTLFDGVSATISAGGNQTDQQGAAYREVCSNPAGSAGLVTIVPLPIRDLMSCM